MVKKKRKKVGKKVVKRRASGKRISKKKSVKKVNRVKRIKRSSGKKVSSSTRKDFEVFAKGVHRLEELKMELDNLDTTGFEREDRMIRNKLKNVSYIPDIEKEMVILKRKINGTYSERGVSDSVERKIKGLEREINRRKNVKVKRQLDKEEVKAVREIPKIERQLSELKSFVKEKNKEEKRKREMLDKIDPGVSFIVNNKFSLSLDEIKAELSNKLREKELKVQKQLQDDLELRKRNFELQYKQLENKFRNQYKEKVRNSLEKEVSEGFNEQLRNKVKEIRKKMNRELKVNTSKKLRELEKERKKMRAMLERKNRMRIKIEEDRLKSILGSKNYRGLKSDEKKLKEKLNVKASLMMKKEKDKLDRKYEELKRLARRDRDKELNLDISKKFLEKLKRDLSRDFETKKRDLQKSHDNQLEAEKDSLRKHFDEEVLASRVMLDNKMNRHLTAKSRELHLKYEKLKEKNQDKVNKLEKEKHDAIKEAVREQSGFMREKLKREFNNKLKLEIKAKEAEFDKRKADLALDVQRKAKELFG